MKTLLWLLTAVLAVPSFAQDPAMKSIPTRVELHMIPTLTISEEGFLKGDDSGKPVTVTGPGHDPAATEAARKAVADFLRTTFRLGG